MSDKKIEEQTISLINQFRFNCEEKIGIISEIEEVINEYLSRLEQIGENSEIYNFALGEYLNLLAVVKERLIYLKCEGLANIQPNSDNLFENQSFLLQLQRFVREINEKFELIEKTREKLVQSKILLPKE